MRKSACLLGFLVSFYFDLCAFAVEKGELKSFEVGNGPFTPIIQEPNVPRVRIPIKLTLFEEVIIQDQHGARRIEAKKLKPVAYNLRATINRTNHFYLSNWHIETVPMKWNREQRQWLVDLKFYKRFGEDQDLEEYAGVLSLSGRLEGNKDILTFDAKGTQKLQNKFGSPLLIVEAGKVVHGETGPVASRDP